MKAPRAYLIAAAVGLVLMLGFCAYGLAEHDEVAAHAPAGR